MKIINKIYKILKKAPQHSAPTKLHTQQERSMDDLLAALSLYGNPKLIKMETGWWCFIESADQDVGAKLTIGSEIRHTHPAHAISECLQRVEASGLPKHPPSGFIPLQRLRT